MRKTIFIISLMILSLTIYCNNTQVNKSIESSITKDRSQNIMYLSYWEVLRKDQGTGYVNLFGKQKFWYIILNNTVLEKKELLQNEIIRIIKSQHLREVS